MAYWSRNKRRLSHYTSFFLHRYYHEYFLRGRVDLCRFMVRTRVKGIGMKAASSPATEPNFYTYESCPVEGAANTTPTIIKMSIACNGNDGDDDDDESMSSARTEPQLTLMTSFAESLSIPNIISPPESPILSSATIVQVPDFLPSCILDIAKEQGDDNDKKEEVGTLPGQGPEL